MATSQNHQAEMARLTQKIVLLFHMNHVPERPFNDLDRELQSRTIIQSTLHVGTLSIRQERRIAEAFVLLVAYNDDPRRVTAACVQEESSGLAMTIKLAVNHGRLDCAERQLRAIGGLLREVNKLGNVTAMANRDLLRRIVSLTQDRILCKLRSKHARHRCNSKKEKKTGTSWAKTISKSLEESVRRSRPREMDNEVAGLCRITDTLKHLYLGFEDLTTEDARSDPGLNLLVEIIGACESLNTRVRRLNNLELNSRSSVRALKSISRYGSISKLLLRYASILPAFGGIDFEVVTVATTPDSSRPLDPEVLELIRNLSGTPYSKILALQSRKQNRATIDDLILQTSRRSSPIHAEIQLLLHFENIPDQVLKPRIISSSKHACFLCNLFFKAHGHFLIPSSHGRLYEKWALPIAIFGSAHDSRLRATLNTFSKELDIIMRDLIRTYRKPYRDPKESTTFPSVTESVMTAIAPSLCHTEVLNQRESIKQHEDFNSDESQISSSHILRAEPSGELSNPHPSLEESFYSSASSPKNASLSSSFELAEELEKSSVVSLGNSTQPIPERMSSVCNLEPIELQPGDYKDLSLTQNSMSVDIHTTNMHLTLDWSLYYGKAQTSHGPKLFKNVDGAHKPKDIFRIRIECLEDLNDNTIVRNRNGTREIDIESLPKGLDVIEELQQQEWPREMSLRHRSQILRLNFISS